MQKHLQFHGSDLEKIEKIYNIPKEEIVCFASNVNPLGLSEQVKNQLVRHLDIITTYPDRNYSSLRRVIGKYSDIDPDYIVVGNGSTELISLLIQHRAPKSALLLGPTYSEYERELSLCGGKLSYYTLSAAKDFQLDVSDFCRTLDDTIDLLIICNPNNPTSSAISVSDLKAIVQTCQKLDIFVMIDETYIEFVSLIPAFSVVCLVPDYDNLMVLRGVSKFFAAPGLRLGYGMTSNVHFRNILKQYQNPWSLNSVGAFVGELFLQDTDYIQKTRQLIETERTRIYETLQTIPELKAFKPSANFVLVQILKEGVTSFDVFDNLIRQKLMIRDCSSFEQLDGEFIRFCIMSPEENTRLLYALKTFFSEN